MKEVDEIESDAASGHVFNDIHCLLLIIGAIFIRSDGASEVPAVKLLRSSMVTYEHTWHMRKVFKLLHINKIFELGVCENLQEHANYFSVDIVEKDVVEEMESFNAINGDLSCSLKIGHLLRAFRRINKIFEIGVSANLQELANYFSVDNVEKAASCISMDLASVYELLVDYVFTNVSDTDGASEVPAVKIMKSSMLSYEKAH
ncbi:hypothetical protein E3N88_14380 [Mikania micrantha]|uniref:Uncharacterized protein n=1 Tax=Mikania micrantha TaxID=192012 RepID=A0A5N6P188_9ASTR|nr:hypothetical protein E3N88_14380 [Mikania micrantha]